MTIYELVKNQIDACVDGYDKLMDIDTARIDVQNLTADADVSSELPDDLTPENYMAVWNEIVESGEANDWDDYEDDWDKYDDYDRGSYSPSAPWNAPGMRISDFISGVVYW